MEREARLKDLHEPGDAMLTEKGPASDAVQSQARPNKAKMCYSSM